MSLHVATIWHDTLLGHEHQGVELGARGRWDSKEISMSPDEPWPLTWPKDDRGGFDTARYSCFLTLQPVGEP